MHHLANITLSSLLALALVTLPERTTANCSSPETSAEANHDYSCRRFHNILSLIPSPSLASQPANHDIILDIASSLEAEAATCRPNVCIAFDGSASVSAATFAAQVQAAQIITAVLSGLINVSFAAVQYGSIVHLTSRTTEGRRAFQMALGASVAERGPITFVAPALQFCSTQFSTSPDRTGNQANRIVLLGGAMSSFFADTGPFGAAALAQQFLAQGDHKISGLLVGGDGSAEELLQSVVGGGLLINAPDEASLLVGIAEVIQNICN